MQKKPDRFFTYIALCDCRACRKSPTEFSGSSFDAHRLIVAHAEKARHAQPHFLRYSFDAKEVCLVEHGLWAPF
jgi:hypothetical protein